jgi:hypothetical protein
MKLLTNPIFIRMGLVLFASCFAFLVAVTLMRRVRTSLAEDASTSASNATPDQLPLHTYHAVIQQLCNSRSSAAQKRLRTSAPRFFRT